MIIVVAVSEMSRLVLAEAAPGFQFDWSISIGNVATIVTMMFVAALYFRGLGDKVILLGEKVTTIKKDLKDELVGVKEDIRELEGVIAKLAAYEERFNSLDHRINRAQEDVDLLRRGEGFVLPDPFREKLSRLK